MDLHSKLLTQEELLPAVEFALTCEQVSELDLVVRRMGLREQLSGPFELDVSAHCDPGALLDAETLLDTNCSLTIERRGMVRALHGVINQVELRDHGRDHAPLRLRIVPALQLLEHRIDTRLWQAISIPELVRKVLAPHFSTYDRQLLTDRLTHTYPELEYVVQYDESDLDFVSRILEQSGISYHFEHGETGHEVMVLEDSADHRPAVVTLDDVPEIAIVPEHQELTASETLQRLTFHHKIRPTRVSRRAFGWKTPLNPQTELQTSADEPPSRTREHYRHGYVSRVETADQTRLELTRAQIHERRFQGRSNITGLAPGARFTIADTDRPELEIELMVTKVDHRGERPEVDLDSTSTRTQATYVNDFECVPFDRPYAPSLNTAHPVLQGPQTAIVTGPKGEEVHTDEHGRIKVRFNWDRHHSLTDDTSMWVRVSHAWAGAGYGCLFTPRVGMEVVVEFIEGNPDRPLVVGCVHNGISPPGVSLPESKTKSVIRTASSPGGGGFNEPSFEDAAGSEVISLHAQRDLSENILACHRSTVGRDYTQTVAHNHSSDVKGDLSLVVKGRRSSVVDGDVEILNRKSRSTTVEEDEVFMVFGRTSSLHHQSHERRVLGRMETHVLRAGDGEKASSTLHVAGDRAVSADLEATTSAGNRLVLVQGAPSTGVSLEFNAGHVQQHCAHTHKVSTGETHEISAGDSLSLITGRVAELRSPGASLTLEGDTIVLSAANIRFVVGENTLELNESGLSIEVGEFKLEAKGTIDMSGSTVSID